MPSVYCLLYHTWVFVDLIITMDPVIDYGLHPCMLARTWWCGHSKPEYHGRSDLPAGDGVLLVVVGQTGCVGGNPLEDVTDKRVHHGHCLAGDAHVRLD